MGRTRQSKGPVELVHLPPLGGRPSRPLDAYISNGDVGHEAGVALLSSSRPEDMWAARLPRSHVLKLRGGLHLRQQGPATLNCFEIHVFSPAAWRATAVL